MLPMFVCECVRACVCICVNLVWVNTLVEQQFTH